MIAKELRAELALKKFLDANLWIQLELSELNYSLAENCGLSPEEYRLKCLQEAFEAEADAHECDCWDFILQWVAETKEELELMREERMKEIYDLLDD
ncbi:hypothetical protein SAMN05216205_1134 [Pseudomonas mohnii]|uniref:Uncharacterized protein n=1 Tax=Pseudomonas mohnii TaxID=395600 RepID=A0ABY0XRE7_9PSED|nr:DUF6388 family protein [Pseudomonas mohnii]SEB97651.1 hypothetical protein SAMN05216205_1134 [Pseudomonas mohnii]